MVGACQSDNRSGVLESVCLETGLVVLMYLVNGRATAVERGIARTADILVATDNALRTDMMGRGKVSIA